MHHDRQVESREGDPFISSPENYQQITANLTGTCCGDLFPIEKSASPTTKTKLQVRIQVCL